MLRLPLFAFVFSSLRTFANAAYQFDGSCSASDREAILPHLQCGINLANNVHNILTVEGSIGTNIDRVLTLLLGEQPTNPFDNGDHFTAREYVEMYFNGVFPPGWTAGIQRPTWAGVTAVGNGGEIAGDLGANDVKIFCNEDRYEWHGNIQPPQQPDWFDPAVNQYSRIYDQSRSPKECGLLVFAYTQVPVNPSRPSVVTVCPEFVQYMSTHKFPRCESFKLKFKSMLQAGAINTLKGILKGFNAVYTPIDVAALPAKVMLHELFHTRPGGAVNDVGWRLGEEEPDGFGAKSYGWKNCKKLALIHDDRYIRQTATYNADTWALVASALNLINAFAVVHDDGRLSAVPDDWFLQPGKLKRSLDALIGRNLTDYTSTLRRR